MQQQSASNLQNKVTSDNRGANKDKCV